LATEIIAKVTLGQRAVHELKELAILTAYLYVTLGAVIVMKTAVLHTHGIDAAVWGIAIVKALVLAKFMLIGQAMKIGERYTARPLIWPTLHKAFAFLVLLIIMNRHRGSRRRPDPPSIDCVLARRSFWHAAGRNGRWHPHPAAGAHSLFRLSCPRGASEPA
jgi:hypothetical protein